MKIIQVVRYRLSGLFDAVFRYPVTVIFLLAAAVVVAMAINHGPVQYRYLLTFIVGASLGFTMQAIWERFFDKAMHRIVLMGISVLLTGGYFLIVQPSTTTGWETWIRTAVALFALAMAFIWVPSIKSRISFNESFMGSFKSFFGSLLFSGVLFFGVNLILLAVDQLLFPLSEKPNMHAANLIMLLFAPIYFLSMIPVYPGASMNNWSQDNLDKNEEKIAQSTKSPRFLEILISYVIIPLLSVYTVILVAYIALNITGKFWADNRLEPMLVGFAITVILVYVLSSGIENRFTQLFQRISPKVLVPIVLFQIVSSVLRIQDTGITYGRYYVILFGIFAAISGVILSLVPVRKNGLVAALLIVFSLVSIVPPIDAFTISRNNQQELLRNALERNNMLLDQKIIPNASIPDKDKKIISNSAYYLGMMGYTKNIDYLGKDFEVYDDFYNTFGFYRYQEISYGQEAINLMLNQRSPVYVSGYDAFVVVETYYQPDPSESEYIVCELEKEGRKYDLIWSGSPEPGRIKLKDFSGEEIIYIDMKDVYDMFDIPAEGNYQISKDSMTADQATFMRENDKAAIRLVARYVNIDRSNSDQPYGGEFYILVQIK